MLVDTKDHQSVGCENINTYTNHPSPLYHILAACWQNEITFFDENKQLNMGIVCTLYTVPLSSRGFKIIILVKPT